MTTSRIVRLNVGGSIFSTTKATLTSNPDSFLARLVDSDLPSTVDESGALFIDRCPVRFRHVLNFLRDGSLPHWAQRDAWRLDEVAIEADFFQIEGLTQLIAERFEELSLPLPAQPPTSARKVVHVVLAEKGDAGGVLDDILNSSRGGKGRKTSVGSEGDGGGPSPARELEFDDSF